MSTVIFVEQRPPFIVMLASRIPTYTHIIISLLAVLLIQAFPSWATAKPAVREISRKRRSASLTSNAATLVDSHETDVAKEDMSEQDKTVSPRVSFTSKVPLGRLNSSIKMAISRSKSIIQKPDLSRRLSLPARRFSMHIVTAMHKLTPDHHCPQENSNSYFPTESVIVEVANSVGSIIVQNDNSESVASRPIISIPSATKVESVTGDRANIKQRETCISIASPRKTTSFKRFVRRASVAFDIRRS